MQPPLVRGIDRTLLGPHPELPLFLATGRNCDPVRTSIRLYTDHIKLEALIVAAGIVAKGRRPVETMRILTSTGVSDITTTRRRLTSLSMPSPPRGSKSLRDPLVGIRTIAWTVLSR